ncbi:unnamed protein product, partial [Discosporangium mesarthrocarpum]
SRVENTSDGYLGTVRFVGKTDFALGMWVGLELDEQRGKNNGQVNSQRYFKCKTGHGLFVQKSAFQGGCPKFVAVGSTPGAPPRNPVDPKDQGPPGCRETPWRTGAVPSSSICSEPGPGAAACGKGVLLEEDLLRIGAQNVCGENILGAEETEEENALVSAVATSAVAGVPFSRGRNQPPDSRYEFGKEKSNRPLAVGAAGERPPAQDFGGMGTEPSGDGGGQREGQESLDSHALRHITNFGAEGGGGGGRDVHMSDAAEMETSEIFGEPPPTCPVAMGENEAEATSKGRKGYKEALGILATADEQEVVGAGKLAQ